MVWLFRNTPPWPEFQQPSEAPAENNGDVHVLSVAAASPASRDPTSAPIQDFSGKENLKTSNSCRKKLPTIFGGQNLKITRHFNTLTIVRSSHHDHGIFA